MHHSKAQLIVGGGIGLLAFLGVALSLLRPSSVPLQERVEAFYPKFSETAQQRHADVDKKIATLEGFRQDQEFRRLPEPHREQVENLLKELRAFQSYEQGVAAVPDPAGLRREDQFQAMRDQLAALDLPAVYSTEWSQTDAGKRHVELLDDFQSLETAVAETRRRYLQFVDEGKDVLRNDEAPQLPQRARHVLERAQKLPEPERDAGKPVPGSPRIKYAQVFEFPGVKDALRAWAKVRDQLRPLTLSPKP